jgi:hypothetical protein
MIICPLRWSVKTWGYGVEFIYDDQTRNPKLLDREGGG